MKSDWTPGLIECNVTGGLHRWEEGSESDHGRGRYRCSACFVYLRPLDVIEDMMWYREKMIEWRAKYDAVDAETSQHKKEALDWKSKAEKHLASLRAVRKHAIQLRDRFISGEEVIRDLKDPLMRTLSAKDMLHGPVETLLHVIGWCNDGLTAEDILKSNSEVKAIPSSTEKKEVKMVPCDTYGCTQPKPENAVFCKGCLAEYREDPDAFK